MSVFDIFLPKSSKDYHEEPSTPAYESLTNTARESPEVITPVEDTTRSTLCPLTDNAAARIESEFICKIRKLEGKHKEEANSNFDSLQNMNR